MNRAKLLIALSILIPFVYVFVRTMIPLEFNEVPLRKDAIQRVLDAQKLERRSALVCAKNYMYFKTDYEKAVPSRISILLRDQTGRRKRVDFYDPSCRDDSIYSTMDRIYILKNEMGYWVPYKHEYAHRGRGQFFWTTQPTR